VKDLSVERRRPLLTTIFLWIVGVLFNENLVQKRSGFISFDIFIPCRIYNVVKKFLFPVRA